MSYGKRERNIHLHLHIHSGECRLAQGKVGDEDELLSRDTNTAPFVLVLDIKTQRRWNLYHDVNNVCCVIYLKDFYGYPSCGRQFWAANNNKNISNNIYLCDAK